MGRVSAAWLCVLACTGCAQVLGIDNTSAPPDVALPPGATLRLQTVSFGAALSTMPMPLTGQRAAYYIDDDVDTSGLRTIAATLDGDLWRADLPDGVPAAVEFSNPYDPAPRLFAMPNRDLTVQYGIYGRHMPDPAPANANLNVTLRLPSGYASGESFSLYAIGPWAAHSQAEGLPTVDTGALQIGPVDVPFDMTSFPSPVGKRPTPRITAGDTVVALRYAGPTLTAAGQAASFEQTGSDALDITLSDNPRMPLDISVNPMSIATRLSMTSPVNTSLAMDWNVSAGAGWEYAAAGVVLTSGSLVPTETMSTIAAPYGNPFGGLGWNPTLSLGTSRARSFTPPTLALPVTLYAGLNQHIAPTAGATLDMPVGLPVLVLVNDMPLTSDGLVLTLDPNKALTLSLVADRTVNTVYQFNVYELVPNTAMPPTALDRKLSYVAFGTAPEIKIPAGSLATGKTYTIRAHCLVGGFGAIATGDLSQRDLPLSIGYLESGVFTVAAP